MDDDTLYRLGLIAVFALLFVVGGALLPSLYYGHAPMDRFVEVEEFNAENLTTNASTQTLHFTRHVKQGFRGDVLIEMMLVSHESETQVQVIHEQDYFERGNKTVKFTRPVPDNLEPGTYYYVMHIRMRLGDVDRDLRIQSNSFTVYDAPGNESNESHVSPAAVNTTTEVVS